MMFQHKFRIISLVSILLLVAACGRDESASNTEVGKDSASYRAALSSSSAMQELKAKAAKQIAQSGFGVPMANFQSFVSCSPFTVAFDPFFLECVTKPIQIGQWTIGFSAHFQHGNTVPYNVVVGASHSRGFSVHTICGKVSGCQTSWLFYPPAK